MFVLEELEHARRARRPHLRRDRRLRHPLQRLPHDRAAPRRPGDGRGDPRRAATEAADRPRRTSTTSTRTAPAPSRTTGTRPRRSSAASASTPTETPVSSIKSMVGPLARRDRLHRDRRVRAGHGAPGRAADGQPARRPTRSATWTTCRCTARRAHVDARAQSVGSGFGGFQSAMVLARPRGRGPMSGTRDRPRRHRHRRGRPQRPRHRGLLGGHPRRQERHRAARPASTPAALPASGSPARSGLRRRTTTCRQPAAACRPTGGRRSALAAAELALDDAGVDPADLPEYEFGVVTASSLRRHRVRPARAAAAVAQGPPGRQRLPVHRLVLRREHRPDLHPPRHAGAVRRARQRTGRRAGRARATPAG